MAAAALLCSVPQAGRVFMIKHHCGWSRFVRRTRAGTSAKCSCWTSSMTPFTMAAGSTSRSMVCMGLLPGGGGNWKAHSLRACIRGTVPHFCSQSLLQRGPSARLGPACCASSVVSPEPLGSASAWEEQLPGHKAGVCYGWWCRSSLEGGRHLVLETRRVKALWRPKR